jgi:glycosyltransferase involved in cell wall biosynthesis
MRVLCLDQFSESGGAQLCLRDVLHEIRERGWDATVMAPGDGPLLRFAASIGCKTSVLPLSKYRNGKKSVGDLLSFPFDMIRCARLVRQARPFDLIYVNGPRLLPAIAGTSVPVLFHSHSLLNKTYAGLVLYWSLGHQGAVLTCSEFTASSLRRFTRQPIKVIYNGVADCYVPGVRQYSKFLRIGILGRIAPEKGHLDFIKAARLLRDQREMRFSAIGAALFSDPEYERVVHEEGRRAGVEFRGWSDTPAHALNELDILAVPSSGIEASTRVIMEALAAGTIVIAYPAGGIPELIRPGYDGVLTRDASAEELATSIQILAGNPDMRRSLARNGRNTWQTRFTVTRFRREVCDAMQALAANVSHSSAQEETSVHDEASAFP